MTASKKDNLDPGFWLGLLVIAGLLILSWLRANGKI